MTVTGMELLEARVARLEVALGCMEQRLSGRDREPSPATKAEIAAAPAVPFSDAPSFDFTLVGKSVLIVGGAYLLRALTEMGVLPQRAGVILAFLYSIAWIVIADRALAQGRRMAALFDAATTVIIAAPLLGEATVRFHFLTPAMASLLDAITALALLAVAHRRSSGAIAFIAAGMITFTSIGLAIVTGDLVPPMIALAITGAIAWRVRSPAVLILAAASDLLALALIGMAAFGRAPRVPAALTLALTAALWVVITELRPRWPESLQTSVALLIGAGGATVLLLNAFPLAASWSVAALIAAAIGRRWLRTEWTLQVPFWALAATVSAFVADERVAALSIVGMLIVLALALVPATAQISRLTLLGLAVLIALTGANALLATSDAGMLAMERSVALAVAAVLLAFLGRVRSEAAILAGGVLALAGLKLLVEDFRTGRATTIVVALAAYGTAMVILAHRTTTRHVSKENA